MHGYMLTVISTRTRSSCKYAYCIHTVGYDDVPYRVYIPNLMTIVSNWLRSFVNTIPTHTVYCTRPYLYYTFLSLCIFMPLNPYTLNTYHHSLPLYHSILNTLYLHTFIHLCLYIPLYLLCSLLSFINQRYILLSYHPYIAIYLITYIYLSPPSIPVHNTLYLHISTYYIPDILRWHMT